MTRCLGCIAVLFANAIGCAPAATNQADRTAAQRPADWADARDRLEQLRSTWRAREGTTPVVARFRGGDGLEVVDGRGALAVRTPDAIRMIVVAAGGPTAFDLWIRGDRFRLAMPLRDRIVRGREGDEHANLPVGFLRWWLLTPLRGALQAAYHDGAARRWLLHDERATYDVRQSDHDALTIIRRGDGATEQLEVSGPSCPRAEYRNAKIGLQVLIACDPAGQPSTQVSERAFEDPDATRR